MGRFRVLEHRQHRLRIFDLHGRRECEVRDGGGKPIDQPNRRVIGHEMSTAFVAILPLTCFGFLERGEVFGARRNTHRLGLPKTVGVDGTAGPRTAAMAIGHPLRRAADFELNRGAEAFIPLAAAAMGGKWTGVDRVRNAIAVIPIRYRIG